MAAQPVILVTGKDGQVGHALQRTLAPLGKLIAMGRGDCDLSNPTSIETAVRSSAPDIIVNAGAYTAVDKAETDRERTHAVNAAAPGILAKLAHNAGAVLIHYSTDYVFDGSGSTPFREGDLANPLSVYGASKRDGEIAVRSGLSDHLIFRTSWVFSAHGANFLKTMLRLAKERDELAVVADQVGAPTSADLIADVTATVTRRLLEDRNTAAFGTYHLAASGEANWHDYAVYLVGQARSTGLPIRVKEGAIQAIRTEDYPTPAKRPKNSRLDTAKLRTTFGIELPSWRHGVDAVVEKLARS